MLQRLRRGIHRLFILLALVAAPAMGFQVVEVGAQVISGGSASPQTTSQAPSASKTFDCGELAGLVQQERSAISREIGQIKREMAALRDDLSKPGLKEIFAGFGYIFGLAGIGLYFHCRRRKAQSVPGDPGAQ